MAAIALAGCQSSGGGAASRDDDIAPRGTAYGAQLVPKNGSVVVGTIRIVPRDDGVTVNIRATSLRPGRFRVLFHSTGNCSSPNAFSAGAPWSPPGTEPAVLWLAGSSEGDATLSQRLRGYKLDGPDGLVGKSVVLHEATGPLDAQPGVPNGRLACGVIGSMRAWTF
jgi:Cu-Zn family superoxide dismutase